MLSIRLVLLTLIVVLLTPISQPLPAKAGAGPISRDGAVPPFDGTIFLDPDIIVPTDPTTFQAAPYAGQGMRTMFDRRVNDIEYQFYRLSRPSSTQEKLTPRRQGE